MDQFDHVQDLENDSTGDATNTAPKSAAKRSKETAGTTARKQPNKESAGSHVFPVDCAELDQQLDDCKETAIGSKLFLAQTNDSLYRAFAKSYVWWQICNQVKNRFADYLEAAEIKDRNSKREFSSLIRLTFDLNGTVKGKKARRLETKTVNRFATAMDSIHQCFKNKTLTFNDETEIVAYIRQEGGVEALIQQALRRKSGNTNSGSISRKMNLQAGTKAMKRADPLAIIPKHSHDLERNNEEDRDFIMLLGEIDHSGDVRVLSCLRNKPMVQSLLSSIGSDHLAEKNRIKAGSKEAQQKNNSQISQDELVADALEKTPKAKTGTTAEVPA